MDLILTQWPAQGWVQGGLGGLGVLGACWSLAEALAGLRAWALVGTLCQGFGRCVCRCPALDWGPAVCWWGLDFLSWGVVPAGGGCGPWEGVSQTQPGCLMCYESLNVCLGVAFLLEWGLSRWP